MQIMVNQSDIFEVILVGFPGLPDHLYNFVSAVMLLVYIISLVANGSVIILVSLNVQLHKPMYLIIANLAASDLLFDTLTLPKLVARYWFGSSTMSFHVCVFQMFWIHHLGSLDSYLLLLMAIDRYVAVSQPLKYSTIITNQKVFVACGFSWLILAPSTKILTVIDALSIVLCSSNKINTLFCTNVSVLALACNDVAIKKQAAFTSAMIVLLLPLAFILLSYAMIISVIAKSAHVNNWKKAFYTCSLHLFLVALYYIPRIFNYIVTNIPLVVIKADVNAVLLFLYSVVPHLANPIVYFLQTKEIQQTLGNILKMLRF
ncbi:olfactory receptor 52K1-like [Hyperolius riggenbachi]|uniref:olfactory receptor 52K1-like n=1 Tax=Hyperolius riggenbachi TaxID=752182 RepID=UPI0035A397DB